MCTTKLVMHWRLTKTVGKALRNFALLQSTINVIHGFLPEELKLHYAEISISPFEDPEVSLNQISTDPLDDLMFRPVATNEHILGVHQGTY